MKYSRLRSQSDLCYGFTEFLRVLCTVNFSREWAQYPSKVAEEPVDVFRLKYSWDDFNDIESTDLNIVWSGEIDVESSYAIIYLTVDSGWSSVNISVEGELIQADSNCSPCIVPLQLEQGKHSFEIDIHNHWHTTGSSALFSKAPSKKAA